MGNNIDIYSIVTNGLVAEKNEYFILDPLGYYVIKIKETIEREPILGYPGGGFGSGATKKKKKIRLEVTFNDNIPKFIEEFYLDEFDLKIMNAKLIDDSKIELEITNPRLDETVKKIVKITTKNVSLK